jgi:predicted ATP-dependent serine protease
MSEKSIIIPLVTSSSEVHTLKDIKVPEKFFTRMPMGVQVLDELFGGQDWPGILPGTSMLFTGMPGAGKSTAALQFADLLQRNAGRNILYNVGEENEYMVKMRADRLGITGEFGLSTIEDVDLLLKTCTDLGVEVLFQDSLQSLRIIAHCKKHAINDAKCAKCEYEAKHNHLARAQMLKAVTKKLHKFAKDTDTTVWIIGHITKGGEFAGPMEVKHDIDVHAHIRLNPDTMAREFMLTKNRFGPAGIPYECNLTAKGLDFAAMQLVEGTPGESKSSKANERREQVDKIIKEALLAGQKVSAYDKDKLLAPHKLECSGGFWRSRLEKVRYDLAAEGHVIGEVRLEGRLHIFVEV